MSIWDKNDPAIYPHPITNHWTMLKYQSPGLSLSVPDESPPYYKESMSRFRCNGCLSSVAMSRISDYLVDEFSEMKPGAYPATKPRVPVEFANPYEEMKLSSFRYWIEGDFCGNLCPMVRNKVPAW
ncbi:uncharacterized protein LOC144491851 [Mustelus asterias]